MIYLDQSSTSYPKAPGVGDAMRDFLEYQGVNIGRGNYREAYSVELNVLDTRERLARLFGYSDPRSVIFTPGVTFSLNAFFNGYLDRGDHVVVSGMEHNAVMRPLTRMANTHGIRYTVAKANRQGQVCVDAFEEAIEPATRAIVTLHASNVCGTILPVEAIGQLCREKELVFALDTAQTAGSVALDMEMMNIDFLAFTGHKTLGGPQGIGGFIVKKELAEKIEPFVTGGTGSRSDSFDQPSFLPDKFESGTLNLPGILGLRAALIYLETQDMETLNSHKMALTKQFLDGVREIPGVEPVGLSGVAGRTAVASLNFSDRDNADIAYQLEKRWTILTRVGLQCAPVAHQSLGTFPQGTVRFSIGATNTAQEIDTAIEALRQLMC